MTPTLTQHAINAMTPDLVKHVIVPLAGASPATIGNAPSNPVILRPSPNATRPKAGGALIKRPFGSSTDPNAMDVDQSTFHAIQIQPNSRNPYGLDENCVFVSMAYLVSTRSDNVTPHDIVNMSEMMQPADGRGGLEPYDIERLLAAVAEKKRLKYVFQQWSDHRALDEVLESHGTKKVAVLYRRNNKYRTGHCVVWDMDLQGNGQKGYLDFQQAQHPVPCEKDGDEYIDDMLEYYFLFEGRA